MAHVLRYRALSHEDRGPRPLVVVDLGYSARKATCGLACTDEEPKSLKFSEAVQEVSLRLSPSAVLVLEAPLSTFHWNGNPAIRGAFENRRPVEGGPRSRFRGWYCGAGAIMALAAQRFLWEVAKLRSDLGHVLLAEAFLSNKTTSTSHKDDAARILSEFWKAEPQPLEHGVEPVSELIDGVPPIRVFLPLLAHSPRQRPHVTAPQRAQQGARGGISGEDPNRSPTGESQGG